MMEKRTKLNHLAEHGLNMEVLNFRGNNALEKIASGTYIPPELDSVIRDIQSAPDSSSVYLYDRALGAGEIYGPNNNGDFFSKQALLDRHHTFVKNGALYRHHKSRGPKLGDVLASAYNDRLDTVDLILRAPVSNLSNDIEKLANGFTLASSMGAGVPYDVCSYCGNKAKSRKFYCSHLKYQMLNMLEDGTLFFAYNPNPTFKDISLVVIPAAPESAVLRKIASKQYLQKKAALNIHIGTDRGIINPKVIEKLASRFDPEDLIATLHYAKGVLRPDEFDAILKKDASLIREDVVPFVGMKNGIQLVNPTSGQVLTKLARHVAQIPNLPSGSEIKHYPMDEIDKNAYLKYRISSMTIPGDFLR